MFDVLALLSVGIAYLTLAGAVIGGILAIITAIITLRAPQSERWLPRVMRAHYGMLILYGVFIFTELVRPSWQEMDQTTRAYAVLIAHYEANVAAFYLSIISVPAQVIVVLIAAIRRRMREQIAIFATLAILALLMLVVNLRFFL